MILDGGQAASTATTYPTLKQSSDGIMQRTSPSVWRDTWIAAYIEEVGL